MAQQKSERGTVPQGRRKTVPTDGRSRGGKAAPVNEQTGQRGLRFGTAENPAAQPAAGATDRAEADPSVAATHGAPKPERKEGKAMSVTMEAVCERLEVAFLKVASNKGAPGPDRQSIEQVFEHLSEILPVLKTELLNGTYAPGNIRRVWIEKAGGGQRGLGIPNVIDRMVQESVRQVFEPVYEPTFHEGSHGFRPGRSGHTAIAAARAHVEDGYEFVVDLDLEKFFDQVSHQRLMARRAQRVVDRRLLVLVGKMLKASVVMPDGVVVRTEEGVPQGGPFTPPTQLTTSRGGAG